MNRAETNDLLTLIAVYDNRRIDDATVIAWQLIFADLALDDCRTAVVRHFATSDVYLMPVHIRRLVDELHRDRAARYREERQAIMASQVSQSGPTRDRSGDVDELLAELRRRLPAGDPDSLRYGSRHWREVREARERQERAQPNPHFDSSALARLDALDQAVTAMTPPEESTPEEP